MKATILTDFISDEECSKLLALFDKIATVSPNGDNHRCALGYPGYYVAAKINMENPALPLTGNKQDDEAIYLMTEIYERVRKTLSDVYGKDLILIHSSYTEISKGPGMELHSDKFWLDGSLREDDISIAMEHSAVLYLNTGDGVDFTGGDLYFPTHDYRYVPQRNNLVYFIGDFQNIHIVEDVISGARKSISIFFGYRDFVEKQIAIYESMS